MSMHAQALLALHMVTWDTRLTHAFFVMSGQLKSWNSPGKEGRVVV